MKLIIESTTKVVTLNGVQCRIWEGTTASGIKVHAYIPRVGVDKNQDNSQFQAELEEQRPPSLEIEAIPLRMLL
jgi:hypothetical protein